MVDGTAARTESTAETIKKAPESLGEVLKIVTGLPAITR